MRKYLQCSYRLTNNDKYNYSSYICVMELILHNCSNSGKSLNLKDYRYSLSIKGNNIQNTKNGMYYRRKGVTI